MRLSHICVGLILMCLGAIGFQALGEGTATETQQTWTSIHKTTISWSISSNGWAIVNGGKVVDGQLLRIVVPAQSTTNTYDMTITDEYGVDLLQGAGTGPG